MNDTKKTIKISPIRNGTVIDHIRCGQSLKVLKILGLTDVDVKDVVSIAMNVESSTGKKDIVKVENKEISSEELDKISLIAPETTINIIRDFDVADKHRVKLPSRVKGILRCRNRNCITYKNEPVDPEFKVISSDPVNIKCIYCEREMKEEEISENLL
ncbi:MAG: aspartate carbamoyltransferase regulatory subunit [Thermoplasmata archaeon]